MSTVVAGVDTGMACTKAMVMAADRSIIGRAIVPTRGYFRDCALEALSAACEDAGIAINQLGTICGTGFAPDHIPNVSLTVLDTTCHAAGAWFRVQEPLTLIDLGGHVPKVIRVLEGGPCDDVRTARRCALGVGTFLDVSAMQLDIHVTRLEELAAGADTAAPISSYCSVFAGTEVLERLRDGCTREAIARGCIESVADRISEIGALVGPVCASGGVCAWVPGVLKTLEDRCGESIRVLPEPILNGALGAALKALDHQQRQASATARTGSDTP